MSGQMVKREVTEEGEVSNKQKLLYFLLDPSFLYRVNVLIIILTEYYIIALISVFVIKKPRVRRNVLATIMFVKHNGGSWTN